MATVTVDVSPERLADAFARALLERLECEGELPLPEKVYDVVVDDPELTRSYVYFGVTAISARHAGVIAYRRAARAEGHRLVATMAAGDEHLIESGAVSDCALMYATVHLAGRHPAINYVLRRQADEAWDGYERKPRV